MAQRKGRRTAQDSPQSAARLVRRGAQTIREGSTRIGQYRAECLALIDWAEKLGLILAPDYLEQFKYVGQGAEHQVYRSAVVQDVAIKSTHPNRFGYSTSKEGAWATPLEYLRRLAFQNFIFGDDILIVGVVHIEGHIEIVTSQPWINAHDTSPNPAQTEIDAYMGEFGFVSLSFDLDTPIYINESLNLIAADAHDRNVIRDAEGNLVAIDLIIGTPNAQIKRLHEEMKADPLNPF